MTIKFGILRILDQFKLKTHLLSNLAEKIFVCQFDAHIREIVYFV